MYLQDWYPLIFGISSLLMTTIFDIQSELRFIFLTLLYFNWVRRVKHRSSRHEDFGEGLVINMLWLNSASRTNSLPKYRLALCIPMPDHQFGSVNTALIIAKRTRWPCHARVSSPTYPGLVPRPSDCYLPLPGSLAASHSFRGHGTMMQSIGIARIGPQ